MLTTSTFASLPLVFSSHYFPCAIFPSPFLSFSFPSECFNPFAISLLLFFLSSFFFFLHLSFLSSSLLLLSLFPSSGPGDSLEEPGWQNVVKWTLEDYSSAEKVVAQEAAAGAKIVMFPELALTTFDGPGVTDDRISLSALVGRLAAAARENGVFIGAGIGTNDPFSKVEGLSALTKIVLELESGMVGIEANR